MNKLLQYWSLKIKLTFSCLKNVLRIIWKLFNSACNDGIANSLFYNNQAVYLTDVKAAFVKQLDDRDVAVEGSEAIPRTEDTVRLMQVSAGTGHNVLHCQVNSLTQLPTTSQVALYVEIELFHN